MWTKRKEDAYESLDKAIEEIRAAYKEGYEAEGIHDEDVLVGWVVMTSAVDFVGGHPDYEDDPLDTRSIGGWYTKRGQHPVLSYGIAKEGLRHYNDVTVNEGDSE